MVMTQKSTYITTYTKRKVNPLAPKAGDIDIVDIAHALSLLCRANGHFPFFYSVAQHSIRCAKEAVARGLSNKIILACLLHDASEAYLSDLTRPIKSVLSEYKAIEIGLQNFIYSSFQIESLNSEELENINDIDDCLLNHEFESMMQVKISEKQYLLKSTPNFMPENFKDVEHEFIKLYDNLSGKKVDNFIGVDGCTGGWIAAIIFNDSYRVKKYKNIYTIVEDNPSSSFFIVDMPIGLQNNPTQKRPDDFARKELKGRASCVFPTPCRQAVLALNDPSPINEHVLGKKLSLQTCAIIPKIREVDCFLQEFSQYKNIVIESHPEVAFARLNLNGKVFLNNKKTIEGFAERYTVLKRYIPSLNDNDIYNLKKTLKCEADDILDALCLAIVAKLHGEQKTESLPGKPDVDDTGILMQMIVPVKHS